MPLTYQVSRSWKVDVGKLLVATSYNSGQGATTLLGIDYSPYGFVTSAPLGMQAGRDYGLAGRGYLFKDFLEVRAGVYQGVRGEGATKPFRAAGRLVWYPFDARTDFFYPGTTFGTKKVLALGLSHDQQSSYQATGGDVYLDIPLAATRSRSRRTSSTSTAGPCCPPWRSRTPSSWRPASS